MQEVAFVYVFESVYAAVKPVVNPPVGSNNIVVLNIHEGGFFIGQVDSINVKDVQEWLGHSSAQSTLDIYAHLDVEKRR
jgi:integrase